MGDKMWIECEKISSKLELHFGETNIRKVRFVVKINSGEIFRENTTTRSLISTGNQAKNIELLNLI